ncbi:pyridoxamine 5'-phosphate oxidase family protein [Actimicrobium antarcticum]|uniref:Pyridoxamine 5'-phosphate oxidase Alr4036 family FMN-binding domain-containing protein n=1 Tax=Actimicrobium antarcticum TaxID=1051899 RepID=A0ABP7TA59_9BURK
MHTIDHPAEPFPNFYNDLNASLHYAWLMLGRATKDRKAPFRTPVMATQSDSGPQARVLVLRAVDPELRQLVFHTDLRSGKVTELGHDPRVAVTFYDAHRKVQLRISGHASLHTDDALAQQRWRDASPAGLRCFSGALPAAVCATPTDNDAQASSSEEIAEGRSNFVVLVVEIAQIEWLYLHSRGQRRALYRWADAQWGMDWINP